VSPERRSDDSGDALLVAGVNNRSRIGTPDEEWGEFDGHRRASEAVERAEGSIP
jgi:hypothetical protein